MAVKKRYVELVVIVLGILSLLWLLSLLTPQGGITGYITSDDAQAGNVTVVNLSITKTSGFWQGLFGEVFEDPASNQIPSIKAVGGQMTEFNITLPCLGKEIYVSANPDPSLPKVKAGKRADLDTYLQLSSASQESGSQVFTTTSSFSVFSSNITNVPTTYTLVHNSPNNTSFDIGLLNESRDFVFVTHLSFDTIGFDNKTHDYQMMVPVNQTALTYFFFSDCLLAAPAPAAQPVPQPEPAAPPLFPPPSAKEAAEIQFALGEIIQKMKEERVEETEMAKIVQLMERGEIFKLDVNKREMTIVIAEVVGILPQFIEKTSDLLKRVSVDATLDIIKEEAGVITSPLPMTVTIINYLVKDPFTKDQLPLAKVSKKISAEDNWLAWEVVEAVPKTVVPTADDIIFITQKPEIIERDPIMKWTFLNVTKGEKKDISYLIVNKSLEIYEAVYFTAGTKLTIEKPIIKEPVIKEPVIKIPAPFPIAKLISVIILLIIVVVIVIVWRLSAKKKKSPRRKAGKNL